MLKDEVLALNNKSYVTVRDLLSLSVGGRDKFSCMGIEELELLCHEEALSYVRENLVIGDYAVALRWFLRGLNLDYACRKAEVVAVQTIRNYRKRKCSQGTV